LNIRGFNSAFNPKNLQMNDGRLSTLVATGLPFGSLSTVVKDDIERIEIVLGPTAALYGPNAHNGLVSTISKDPRTSEGTTLAIGGGSQKVMNGRIRHANVVSDRFAYKVAVEYLRGEDYEFMDTVYIGSGATAIPQPELELDRDFDSLHGEASAYFTVMPGSDLILSYGGNQSNFLGPTNAGRNQIQDWRIHYLQARWVSPRLDVRDQPAHSELLRLQGGGVQRGGVAAPFLPGAVVRAREHRVEPWRPVHRQVATLERRGAVQRHVGGLPCDWRRAGAARHCRQRGDVPDPAGR
jgi:iron complex outermembrane receptor protein